jgi:hypothetical protein
VKYATLSDLVVDVLSSRQVWREFVESLDAVEEQNVGAPLRALSRMRFIRPNTERELLFRYVAQMGFDIHRDLLNASAENLSKLVTQLSAYADTNGTVDFIGFIDLLCSARSDVTYLYTKDYVNFFSEPKGPMIDEGGAWFATTHIDVMMYLYGVDSKTLTGGSKLPERAKLLFEKFKPTPLVINRFGTGTEIPDEGWEPGPDDPTITDRAALGIGMKMQNPDVRVKLGGFR